MLKDIHLFNVFPNSLMLISGMHLQSLISALFHTVYNLLENVWYFCCHILLLSDNPYILVNCVILIYLTYTQKKKKRRHIIWSSTIPVLSEVMLAIRKLLLLFFSDWLIGSFFILYYLMDWFFSLLLHLRKWSCEWRKASSQAVMWIEFCTDGFGYQMLWTSCIMSLCHT